MKLWSWNDPHICLKLEWEVWAYLLPYCSVRVTFRECEALDKYFCGALVYKNDLILKMDYKIHKPMWYILLSWSRFRITEMTYLRIWLSSSWWRIYKMSRLQILLSFRNPLFTFFIAKCVILLYTFLFSTHPFWENVATLLLLTMSWLFGVCTDEILIFLFLEYPNMIY